MDMFIIYDQVVEVSRSQLVTNTFSLVNRLGGCIGFCKEILWVALLLGGAVTWVQHVSQLFYINLNKSFTHHIREH